MRIRAKKPLLQDRVLPIRVSEATLQKFTEVARAKGLRNSKMARQLIQEFLERSLAA